MDTSVSFFCIKRVYTFILLLPIFHQVSDLEAMIRQLTDERNRLRDELSALQAKYKDLTVKYEKSEQERAELARLLKQVGDNTVLRIFSRV